MPRRIAYLLILVFVSSGLPGCNISPAKPLRIGVLVWPPYEIAFLARDLGYFDAKAIELVDYESPSTVERAYRDGTLDAIMVTADYLIDIAADIPDQRAILVIDFSEGGDALMARREIAHLLELRGKRIGVEKSVLGGYIANRMLEHAGLGIDDVEIVPVDIPDQEAAFRNGDIDAVLTYEPTRSRLAQLGATELFSTRDIPGEIVDLLVTNNQVIASQKKNLEVFVSAWARALDYLRNNPDDSALRVAPRQNLTPRQYLDALQHARIPSMRENIALLSHGPQSLATALHRHVDSMLRQGIVDKKVAVDQLLDRQFVAPHHK